MKKKTLKDLNQSSTMEKGSGSDVNSDISRLGHATNLQDKTEEDTFPASDSPGSYSVGRGPQHGAPLQAEGLPADFKENKSAQFAYGRKSEASTLHFDRSTNRLERGNPDVGDVDLGVIDANEPARKDDNDAYTSPTTSESSDRRDSRAGDQASEKADRMADRAERKADVDHQNEY